MLSRVLDRAFFGQALYYLEYALHVVLIKGENLSALAKGIERMRIRVVRPPKGSVASSEVRISCIEVALRNAGDE